MADLVVS